MSLPVVLIDCRKLVITLDSAEDLPNVRSMGRMKVYAQVSLKGSESETTQKSPVDMQRENNPRWNFPVEYTISESSVEKPGVELTIQLLCKRTFGDRFIGEVSIPVKSLFDMGLKAERIMSYDVAGTPTRSGKLNISYSFGEKVCVPKPKDRGKFLRTAFFVLLKGALILMNIEGLLDDDNDDDINDND